jgi:hypothetical protein
MNRLSVTEAGPGDYIKVGGIWKQIKDNTAYDVRPVPRSWVVTTTGGETFGMYDIELYGQPDHRREGGQ